jgi:hypothetical protein
MDSSVCTRIVNLLIELFSNTKKFNAIELLVT